MPTSAHDPADTLRPATPAGYQSPQPFRYSLLVLLGLVAVLLPVAAVVFGGLLWYAQGTALDAVFSVEETATSITFTLGSGLVAVACVGAIVAVTILHELVHGLVYRWFGYRVSYGVAPQLGAFYAATFHQFQERNHNIIVGIAPLVVLDALLLPLLFAPVPLLAFAAFVALLFNTAGAAGDLYLVVTLLRTPAGSLMYDSDIRHSYLFAPES
ncbi:DUF3267 domain-containing protein [Haloarcula mannanilytica]|uniref:DUF3267 domain-containing protein n=1 Tax=Haloarcula mannanilytica TaxID=2509225 RepID=UPI0010F51AA5|nr:DUF3267 domain-containing protein [Haloarcula mannanilytica]